MKNKLEEVINLAKKVTEDKGAGYEDSWLVCKTGLDRMRSLSQSMDPAQLTKLYSAIDSLAAVIKDMDAAYPATGAQGA